MVVAAVYLAVLLAASCTSLDRISLAPTASEHEFDLYRLAAGYG
jgi:hypothetical protein